MGRWFRNSLLSYDPKVGIPLAYTPPTKPWSELIACYVQAANERQRQPRGIDSYVAVLKRLERHADGAALSPDIVATYIATRSGKSAATVNFEITVIHSWAQYLSAQGLHQGDVLAQVTRPRKRKPVPIHAPERVIRAVVEWLKKGVDRDHRLVGLTLLAGLRISEAVALCWPHVDIEGRELYVLSGKGGDARNVFLCRTLAALLGSVPPKARTGAVAGKADGTCLTPKSGAHVFERHLSVDIGARVSPHMLRRAFATTLDAQGVSLRVIQVALGHADVKTTERYIGVDRRRLREAIEGLDDAWDS